MHAGRLQGPLERLTTLQVLDLSNNQLSGTLPEHWSCPNLTALNLTANNINGTLPTGDAPRTCVAP